MNGIESPEMYSDPWRPYALALRDYFTGGRAAVVTSHSDLFPTDEDPAAVFFRAPEAFWPFERAALELCRGRILADSTDVRSFSDSDDRAPGRPLREDGRYIGEVQFQLEYRGVKAPPFAQLCVDPDTLGAFAERTGWRCEVVFEGGGGSYVARLTR